MKRIIRLISRYRLFSIAIIAVIVCAILELSKFSGAAHWILGLTALGATIPLIWQVIGEVRNAQYGIDILTIVSIITAVILRQYWAAIVVVLMVSVTQALKDYASKRAKTELADLQKNAPETALVIRKGKEVKIKAQDIRVGEKVVIGSGQKIPVDGQVLDGSANISESSMTGKSLSKIKIKGDLLFSGSIVTEGSLIIKAGATAEDSQYQQIIRLVRAASLSSSPFVRLADRYTIPFTFAAVAIAAAVWVLSGQPIRFLEVIIVATPGALLLAAPIALVSGITRASRYGILIKNGTALEKLSDAQTFVFDKTGTLTLGTLKLDQIITYSSYGADEVLLLAASLEVNSNHLLAKAIVTAAKEMKIKPAKAKLITEMAGLGIAGSLKGGSVMVGNLSMMRDAGNSLPKQATQSRLSTAAFVARNQEVVGAITFTDELRSDAAEAVRGLRHLGVKHVSLVTGDNAVAGENIAGQLKIKEVYSEAGAAEKLNILSKIKARPVVFIGDGVNDAPALTSANVGIAFGNRGSFTTSDSADILLLCDNVSLVTTAAELSKKTFGIASQSILIGIGLSLLLMLVFATGKFTPLIGAFVQEAIDIFVIFNALRAHLINPSSMVSQK